MNRQEIVDQLEALSPKYEALRKAATAGLDVERAALQAACGEIGHVFKRNTYGIDFHRRICVVCDQWEPLAAVPARPVALL